MVGLDLWKLCCCFIYSFILIQKLQEALSDFDGKNKNVQESLRKLEGTKKEKDNKAALESLDGQLKGALENIKQVSAGLIILDSLIMVLW